MEKIVIDASVFMKLVFDEPYSSVAYAIRDSYIAKRLAIIVPSLLGYEILNVARYSKLDEQRIRELPEAIDDYQFETIELKAEYANTTLATALKYGITVYDASYVALAAITGVTLYTADEKLIKAVKADFVRHLSEFVAGT